MDFVDAILPGVLARYRQRYSPLAFHQVAKNDSHGLLRIAAFRFPADQVVVSFADSQHGCFILGMKPRINFVFGPAPRLRKRSREKPESSALCTIMILMISNPFASVF